MKKRGINQTQARQALAMQRQLTERHAKPLENAISEFLHRYGMKTALRRGRMVAGRLKKAMDEDDAKELFDLLMRFGINSMRDNKEGITINPMQLNRDGSVKLFQRYSNGAYRRAYDILSETRKLINEDIQRVVNDLSYEGASPGSIARRIQQISFWEGNNTYAFSPGRASVIARTESGIAQNTASSMAYMEVGDVEDEIQWLARKGPGHRHGDLMGVSITIGDQLSSNKSRWFNGPLIKPMRFPHDENGDVGDIVHCMCTTRRIPYKVLQG